MVQQGFNNRPSHGGGRGHNRPPNRNTRFQGRPPVHNNAHPIQPQQPRTPTGAPVTHASPHTFHPISGKPKVKVIHLGGLEEVGRNMSLVECEDDIVLIDMGLQFPEEDMPGIDYIIPNVSYLKGKEKNIRGLIITHGHYDHIGGIPHLMDKIGNPTIYTAPLSAGIIRKRQEDYPQAPQLKIALVNGNTKIQMGKHFVFEPFHINHNISDAFGIALYTPQGLILHTGDFKFDFTPVEDEPADLNRIALFGNQNPLLLMSDSTNAESPGHQISEKTVGEELERIITRTTGRIIIGTFASLLTRMQQILTIAEKTGRHVLLEGRSMQSNVEIAHELGYMKYKTGTIVDEKIWRRLPDNKAIVVCTGAQGERNAVLMRIANSEHRFIQLKKGDTVIFSSSVIPGNERTIQSLKDTFVRYGAKVIHNQLMDVHAGGHAKAEDLKLMLRLTKPRYFLPIHGNIFMRQTHAELAMQVGVPENNVFMPDNGQVVEFNEHGGRMTDSFVPADYVMVDGLGVGDVSQVVLRDRLMMSEDGMLVIIATIEKKTGQLVGNPDLISRGFIYMKENKELVEKTRMRAKKILKDSDPKSPAFEDYIKTKLRNDIGQFLYQQIKRRPLIIPVLIEV
ncbi:MAG: RNA-metabolising metallo-beta-lactamase [Candidatus Magasanikbacteria bacterium GW2011_GWA2_45_39]|uniref:Ribonuclease J n=2 Tax=Candidatus Magasanikiibacteriota TaxID=1752731 RepID=A0A0G1QXK8_9BACT|nr:MAG: RNA-metabolising metallo-beta-lactamase [Candidatus Magasanikbacteria bacterium GW2011_GWA2_45_39]KKU13425.1 MAG: RNA-metabolising metallo-beta-lactamase [Candidatus Magasanikbacteria bacterium GW2011_GWC2_45_8]HBW74056.1 hypothetical protein [Candidatus Magasanikbacteria bacterium]